MVHERPTVHGVPGIRSTRVTSETLDHCTPVNNVPHGIPTPETPTPYPSLCRCYPSSVSTLDLGPCRESVRGRDGQGVGKHKDPGTKSVEEMRTD